MTTAEHERREVRKAMITGVRWLATARLIAQVSSWLITLIVIRLLTPTDYGLQAMVAVLYTLILLISQSGLDRAIARQPKFDEPELRQALGYSLALNTLIMILVWVAAPYVAAYYQEDNVVPLLRTLSLGFVISVFNTIPIGLVWRNLDYRSHAISRLIGTLCASLVTLVLAVLGYGVWALIIGMLVTPAVGALYLQARTRWLVLPSFSISRIKGLIGYIWTISLGFFVWTFAWKQGILIGGRHLSAAALGFLAVAINLCELPNSKILPLANEILYPAYAKLQADRTAVNTYFEKALASLCFLLFPAFFGLAAITHWVVPVVLGSNWTGIETVMVIVAFSMPFRVILSMCNPMLNATGNAMTALATGVLAIALLAIAVTVGVRWGVVGLALGMLAATPVLMAVVLWRTRKSSGISFQTMVTGIGPILANSSIMALIVYWIGTVISRHLPDIGVLAVQVVCGALIYVALAAVFSRSQMISTLSIMRASIGDNGEPNK